MTSIIEHGEKDFQIADSLRVRRPKKDLDTASVQWQTAKLDSFTHGAQFPGFAGMNIEDIETVEEVPGACYLHTISGRGVAGSVAEKIIGVKVKHSTETWDEGRCEILSKQANRVLKGDSLSGYTDLKCVDFERAEEESGWYRFTPVYRGLLSDNSRVTTLVPSLRDEGFDELSLQILAKADDVLETGDAASAYGYNTVYCTSVSPEKMPWGNYYRISADFKGIINSSKPYKRRITVNEEVINPSQPFINYLPNGWEDHERGSYSIPRIVVTDSYVTTTPPPTANIPGNSVPPDAPPLHGDITFSGFADRVRNWPYGWKLASLESDQIPGVALWFVTLSREYVWLAKPS